MSPQGFTNTWSACLQARNDSYATITIVHLVMFGGVELTVIIMLLKELWTLHYLASITWSSYYGVHSMLSKVIKLVNNPDVTYTTTIHWLKLIYPCIGWKWLSYNLYKFYLISYCMNFSLYIVYRNLQTCYVITSGYALGGYVIFLRFLIVQ